MQSAAPGTISGLSFAMNNKLTNRGHDSMVQVPIKER